MAFWGGGGGGHPGFGWADFQNFQNPMSMWTPSPWPIPQAHLSTSKSVPAPEAAPAQPSVGDDDSNSDHPERHRSRHHRRRHRHRSHSDPSRQAVPERARRPHANGEAVNQNAQNHAASDTTSAFWGPSQPFGYPVCDMISSFTFTAILLHCRTVNQHTS